MKKIYCYRRGCGNQATWKIPIRPTLYVCDGCLSHLCEQQGYPEPQRLVAQVGPSEHKEDRHVVQARC